MLFLVKFQSKVPSHCHDSFSYLGQTYERSWETNTQIHFIVLIIHLSIHFWFSSHQQEIQSIQSKSLLSKTSVYSMCHLNSKKKSISTGMQFPNGNVRRERKIFVESKHRDCIFGLLPFHTWNEFLSVSQYCVFISPGVNLILALCHADPSTLMNTLGTFPGNEVKKRILCSKVYSLKCIFFLTLHFIIPFYFEGILEKNTLVTLSNQDAMKQTCWRLAQPRTFWSKRQELTLHM